MRKHDRNKPGGQVLTHVAGDDLIPKLPNQRQKAAQIVLEWELACSAGECVLGLHIVQNNQRLFVVRILSLQSDTNYTTLESLWRRILLTVLSWVNVTQADKLVCSFVNHTPTLIEGAARLWNQPDNETCPLHIPWVPMQYLSQ